MSTLPLLDKVGDLSDDFTLKVVIGERAAEMIYAHRLIIITLVIYTVFVIVRYNRKQITTKVARVHIRHALEDK